MRTGSTNKVGSTIEDEVLISHVFRPGLSSDHLGRRRSAFVAFIVRGFGVEASNDVSVRLRFGAL